MMLTMVIDEMVPAACFLEKRKFSSCVAMILNGRGKEHILILNYTTRRACYKRSFLSLLGTTSNRDVGGCGSKKSAGTRQMKKMNSTKKPVDPAVLSRAQGCLLSQLAGDALGSLVEFRRPEDIRRQYPMGYVSLPTAVPGMRLPGNPQMILRWPAGPDAG